MLYLILVAAVGVLGYMVYNHVTVSSIKAEVTALKGKLGIY